jgi:hypothetical protein
MILHLSSLQSTLSKIDEERGTKIHHQIFMEEELGLKKDSSRTRDQARG